MAGQVKSAGIKTPRRAVGAEGAAYRDIRYAGEVVGTSSVAVPETQRGFGGGLVKRRRAQDPGQAGLGGGGRRSELGGGTAGGRVGLGALLDPDQGGELHGGMAEFLGLGLEFLGGGGAFFGAGGVGLGDLVRLGDGGVDLGEAFALFLGGAGNLDDEAVDRAVFGEDFLRLLETRVESSTPWARRWEAAAILSAVSMASTTELWARARISSATRAKPTRRRTTSTTRWRARRSRAGWGWG